MGKKKRALAQQRKGSTRKGQIILAIVVVGVLLLGAAIFYVNYRQSRELFQPAPKTAITSTGDAQAAEPASTKGSLSQFHYQQEKIQTEILYHYVKSNRDGSTPENIAVYVAAPDRLEVFKYRAPGTAAGYVKAWMDWEIFSAHKLESYRVTAADEQKLVATFEFSKLDQTATTTLFLADVPPEKTAIPLIPFHIFNFDFTSLNIAFRHLKKPRESFELGVPDLVSKDGQWHFVYRGKAAVRFDSEEILRNVRCLKYSINGPGLENRGGSIWVNEAQGHIERMDIDLPDNPDWDHFFFDLKKVESLTPKGWQRFRESHFS